MKNKHTTLEESTLPPRISLELVDYLKETFPNKSITPDNSIEQIMYEAGQNSVIEFLERILQGDEDVPIS